MKVDILTFNNILNNDQDYLNHDYLFYNIDLEKMTEIKKTLQERKKLILLI